MGEIAENDASVEGRYVAERGLRGAVCALDAGWVGVGGRRSRLLGSALLVALAMLACDSRTSSQGSETPGETPGGAEVAVAEPAPVDPDGDGLFGADDHCPEEPGIEPDGCPIRDDDGDGILNPEDRCPDACEVINGVDDDDGCPDPNPGEHPEIQALLGPIEGLAFAVNKDHIKAVSFPVLDGIAEILVRHPLVNLSIDGHRDDRSGDRYGRSQITRKRADSVRQYLVMRGVDPERLTSRGFGEEMPIASNKTAEGRAQNRRIELTLMGPEPTVAPGCKL